MSNKIKFETVVKQDGRIENFIPEKISKSIWYAAQKVGGKDRKLSEALGAEVISYLYENHNGKSKIETHVIGEAVEKILIESGHTSTSKEFIRYRENKKIARKDKEELGITDDIGLSYNTLFILKQRFLKRDEKGEILETPMGMLKRVARFLARAERTKKLQIEWERKFLDIMTTFEFLPGTRTLTNAGKRSAQLANCFVWPIEDDIDEVFGILHQSTLIKKHGGGCGYNFSKIRPEGDSVGGIPGLAAGPVRMIEMYDLMTGLFRQEGKYESGNMAILNVSHPDIFNFISAKQKDGYLSKTNISVGITDNFMKSVKEDGLWKLINPRTGEVANKVKARSIFHLMAQMAWETGDPGLINLSAMNKGTALANPLLKKMGPIEATNPCGEVPLYPYESCNLGYVNFAKMVKDGEFDFQRLKEVMAVAVRLMDNVIESSWFPVPQVTESVRNHRRIGIGAVGWAETLIKLGVAYDSEEALSLAEKVVETMYKSAFKASCDLAEEKGPFPLINDSIWANRKKKPRNVALLTFPPSSSNAVLCETTYGIEPYFAFAYEQNVLEGVKLKTVIPLLIDELKKQGIYSEELIEEIIENHGSVQGIKKIPAKIQKIFKSAHDIDWKHHLKMQAAFQKWTDNAITKTINLPSNATTSEVEKAYLMAWELGCKGLTVYRDQTKTNQVFEFGGKKKEKQKKYCPNCDLKLVRDGKCYKCKKCAFSTCEL